MSVCLKIFKKTAKAYVLQCIAGVVVDVHLFTQQKLITYLLLCARRIVDIENPKVRLTFLVFPSRFRSFEAHRSSRMRSQSAELYDREEVALN